MISNVSIRRDAQGRFSLNDLHKAAGSEQRHQPKYWLLNRQTQALIVELEIGGIPLIESKQGVGTYVVKELVYAYAMWISPKFHLEVIRAYDAMATGQVSDPIKALNDPATMRGLLLNYSEKVIELQEQNKAMRPAVDAYFEVPSIVDSKFIQGDRMPNDRAVDSPSSLGRLACISVLKKMRLIF